MKLLIISEEEETTFIELHRYESKTLKDEDTDGNGSYSLQETYMFYVEKLTQEHKSALNPIYDYHIYILFDDELDGRVKKFYTPSVKVGEDFIVVEAVRTISF